MDLAPAKRRCVFVTGQLAKDALERTLGDLGDGIDAKIEPLRIKVAALMTTAYIRSTLKRLGPCDTVYLPGLCQADEAELSREYGVPFVKGPKDLRDLPAHFGRAAAEYDPAGPHTLALLAEINDVHALSDEALLEAAERYRRSGADLIDLGCTPGRPLPDAGRLVRLLRERGFRVSIDTFDEGEALSADAAGAEMLLSLSSKNAHLAGRLRQAVPVVIPDTGGGLPSLRRNVEAARRHGARRLVLDPILEPIPFGFAASLRRYCETREAFPEAEILMGVGNLTELTEADSTGVNALLLGIMAELKIGYALTTEVAAWARGSVRELDRGRRWMHHAATHRSLPKGYDDALVTTRDPRLTRPTEPELRALQMRITDRNFRIDTDGESIFVYNCDRFVADTNIRDIFPRLGVDDDASHAFYLGRELMKADVARRLGKKYIQGEPLRWGYLTWTEEEGKEHVRAARPRPRRTATKRATAKRAVER